MAEYPEHDKLHKIADKSQKIGEFVDWLNYDKDINLCQYSDGYRDEDGNWQVSGFYEINIPIKTLLAEFFNIDLKKIEEEKDALLAETRALNANS